MYPQSYQRRKMWKLFQTFLFLQNCLILQVASRANPSPTSPLDNNGNALLRSSVNGIFLPISNYTNTYSLSSHSESGESPSNAVQQTDTKIPTVDLQEMETESWDEEETNNKPKRSKAFVKGLLQKVGIISPPSTESTEKERELEAQMAEEEGSDGDADSPSTTPRAGILSKLNPINKLKYKVNVARNVVNRALNVVGLGTKKKAEGAEGDSSGDEGDGATRDSPSTGDNNDMGDGSSSNGVTFFSQPKNIVGIMAFIVVVGYSM